MPPHADAWTPRFGGSRSGFGVWIVPALILSLLLHWLLLTWAGSLHLPATPPQNPPPVVMKLRNVAMPTPPPLPAMAEHAAVNQSASAPRPVQAPDEKKAFEKVMGQEQEMPSAPQPDKTIIADKPASAAANWADTVQTAEASGAQSATESLDAMRKEMLKDKPGVTGSSSLDSDLMDSGGSQGAHTRTGGGGRTPGFSNLDDLLAKTGPLTPETAPILMPTDLLFDFDKANLRPDADASLAKLAKLIERSPNVRFRIEGHTDSFGSDEYNQALSVQRAESVKAWLVSLTHIPAGTIGTMGFGKTRLIAPASGTEQEQQINRRVEIVILPAIGTPQ